MKIANKIEVLFGSLDVVIIEQDFETLIDKNSEPDIFDECLDYAENVLGAGEFASRNPTCWQTFMGKEVEVGSKEWRNGIANILRLTSTHKLSELDNNRNHLKVSIKLEILAVNAKQLPETVLNGAKCVSVQTAFGVFPLVGCQENID